MTLPPAPSPPRAVSHWRWLRVPLLILIGIGIAIALMLGTVHYGLNRERVTWMQKTLPRLASPSPQDTQIVEGELMRLKAGPGLDGHHAWVEDHVVRMADGEHLIYAFYHGNNMGLYDHLFLARGSDGRWFFSTYHFCSHLVAVRFDEPPTSISDFAARYSAREFDGKSDVCLEHTWP